jgi:hypothetical protein
MIECNVSFAHAKTQRRNEVKIAIDLLAYDQVTNHHRMLSMKKLCGLTPWREPTFLRPASYGLALQHD